MIAYHGYKCSALWHPVYGDEKSVPQSVTGRRNTTPLWLVARASEPHQGHIEQNPLKYGPHLIERKQISPKKSKLRFHKTLTTLNFKITIHCKSTPA
jgi:hypothetical protein